MFRKVLIEPAVCNVCHDVLMMTIDLNNIAFYIFTVLTILVFLLELEKMKQ